MKDFFKFTFASCLGVFLAGMVLFFIGSAMLTRLMGSIGSVESTPSISPNSILNISLQSQIPEKTNNVAKEQFDININDVTGLHDIVRSIRHAKTDDQIQGIMIDIGGVALGQANATYLRDEIENFKSSEKFVLAYSPSYTTGTYYLASAADKVYINPFSIMQFDGFAATIPFFKGMLDKMGIRMQVKYAGQFKSATEPFRLFEMSKQNKLQVREYLEGMYEIYLENVAASRNMSPAQLRAIANDGIMLNSNEAVSTGLVDGAKYKDEVLDEIRTRLGLSESSDIPSIDLSDYASIVTSKIDLSSSNKIAVVYAEGTIVDGEGTLGSVGGDNYARMIREARQDDNIKAIVVRVNSGGGSGMASENIWRELELAKAAGKVVVTSMGDVAASGGYYIASNSDAIFAQSNTITGSIGVFAMIPSVQDGMKKHLGISVDTVKTTKFSVGITPFFDMDKDEGDRVQKYIDEFYDHFMLRVKEGRDYESIDAVNEIAQGRVWTGKKAKEIGLVDELGNLDDAIAMAATKAGIDNYRIKEYPKVKHPLEQLLENFKGDGGNNPLAKSTMEQVLQNEFGELYPHVKAIKEMIQTKGVQARMPYLMEFK